MSYTYFSVFFGAAFLAAGDFLAGAAFFAADAGALVALASESEDTAFFAGAAFLAAGAAFFAAGFSSVASAAGAAFATGAALTGAAFFATTGLAFAVALSPAAIFSLPIEMICTSVRSARCP
jgi:hypothetical protein